MVVSGQLLLLLLLLLLSLLLLVVVLMVLVLHTQQVTQCYKTQNTIPHVCVCVCV